MALFFEGGRGDGSEGMRGAQRHCRLRRRRRPPARRGVLRWVVLKKNKYSLPRHNSMKSSRKKCPPKWRHSAKNGSFSEKSEFWLPKASRNVFLQFKFLTWFELWTGGWLALRTKVGPKERPFREKSIRSLKERIKIPAPEEHKNLTLETTVSREKNVSPAVRRNGPKTVTFGILST